MNYTWVILCCPSLWFVTSQFYQYPSGLLHWHWGDRKIAPVPLKQPWKLRVRRTQESTKMILPQQAQWNPVHILWFILYIITSTRILHCWGLLQKSRCSSQPTSITIVVIDLCPHCFASFNKTCNNNDGSHGTVIWNQYEHFCHKWCLYIYDSELDYNTLVRSWNNGICWMLS